MRGCLVKSSVGGTTYKILEDDYFMDITYDVSEKSKSMKYLWITTNYYIVAMLVNFAYIFSNNIRVGVICAIIMMLVVVDYMIRNGGIVQKTFNSTSLFVIFYVIYNLLAILMGVLNGYSASVGVAEFSNGLLPIIFYFIALEMDKTEEMNFVKSFINVCLFLVLVGIFMYIVKPNIYFSYMQRSIAYFHMSTYLAFPRMHSFVGSVVVGSIACMGLAFQMNALITGISVHRSVLLCIIFLIGIVLTMQRSAWVFAVMIFLIMIIYAFNIRSGSFKYIIIYGIMVIVIASVMVPLYPKLIDMIISRVLSMTTAVQERNSNWDYALQQGIGTLVGHGLGTIGHRTMYITDISILDGNYFKMIYEIGLIGTTVFIGIMLSIVIKGLKNFRRSAVYLCIVIGILFQAIGSNVLCFQLVVPMFWFAVGRINYISENKLYKNTN